MLGQVGMYSQARLYKEGLEMQYIIMILIVIGLATGTVHDTGERILQAGLCLDLRQ